jgi:hypothetical protein
MHHVKSKLKAGKAVHIDQSIFLREAIAGVFFNVDFMQSE